MNSAMPKTSQTLTSSRASFICDGVKTDLSRVARSSASLSIATRFSSSVKNHAAVGSEGTQKMKTAPESTVRAPATRKITLQLERAKVPAPPIPYISRAPMICAAPDIEVQILREEKLVVLFEHQAVDLRNSHRVLLSFVPIRCEGNPCWRSRTFAEAEEEPDGSDTGEVMGGSHASRTCTPQQTICSRLRLAICFRVQPKRVEDTDEVIKLT